VIADMPKGLKALGQLPMVDPEKCRDRRYYGATNEAVISPLASFCKEGHWHGLREFFG
jgi:hypothetical protein